MVTRRPTNLSISSDLLEDARAMKLNLSRAAEAGIAKAIADQKARQWREENAEAIKGWNEYVEKHGLPLEKHREF